MDKGLKPHYHFIGIAGIGMSALARLLLQQGIMVSGSDPSGEGMKATLRSLGATIFDSQKKEHLPPGATIVYNSDIAAENVELSSAKAAAMPLIHRAELLAQLLATKPYPLAVSGTHGKTSTTAVLTSLLEAGKCDPTFVVGGLRIPTDLNSNWGYGPHFVFEADESDSSMLHYHPFGAILTNIDSDHLLHYGSLQALIAAMGRFAAQVRSPEHLLWCGDDPFLKKMDLLGYSYGYSAACDFRLCHVRQRGWSTFFDIESQKVSLKGLELPLPGRHIALNAAGAVAMALLCDVSESAIRQGLLHARGVRRRFEPLLCDERHIVIDDYAHHPTEILATLKAIRNAIGTRRLRAVYQPHRYSRMVTLSPTCFVTAFSPADEIIITDLYAAGEAPLEGFSTQALIETLRHTQRPCYYVKDSALLSYLQGSFCVGDATIFLNAGDLTFMAHELANMTYV